MVLLAILIEEDELEMIINRLKAAVPEEIKQRILLTTVSSHNPKWKDYADTDKKRVFVFLAGFYQNLGDLAITFAQKEFLRNAFPEAEIICVPSTSTYSAIKTIKHFIRTNDLVTIIGGGNMDENYPSLEKARLYVVKSFPKNHIVSFPQSVWFSDSDYGKKSAKRSRKVYRKHPHLTIFTREYGSYKRCSRLFPGVRVELVPDIVLSLSPIVQPKKETNKIMICCRNDIEKIDRNGFNKELISVIQEAYSDVVIRDTVDVKIEDCTQDHYEETLFNYWNQIGDCKAVVTDRLHCMLFCVLMGTPCIALDNSNHKVLGVYNTWLKSIPFIKMSKAENAEQLLEEIKGITEKIFPKDIHSFYNEFEPLRKALHE